jgi:pimeloyl-ACP methyl ester carboxylesterase
MATMIINGSGFEYIERGKGTPVIFVHGSLNDYRIWPDQMETFSKHYRAIAYSRRYHYPNKWTGDGSDYNIDLHAQDLADFIKALGAGRAHLVGSSYGAYTILMTSINNPELVKSLVLGEPPILPLLMPSRSPLKIISLYLKDFSTAKSIMNFVSKHMKPATKAAKNNELEKAVRLFSTGVTGDEAYEKLSTERKAGLMDNAPELKAELLYGDFPPFPKEEAGRMTLPTLLVCGQNSPKFFQSISDILGKILPNSEKVVIPDSGHLIHGENPDYYNEKVLEFLKKND